MIKIMFFGDDISVSDVDKIINRVKIIQRI